MTFRENELKIKLKWNELIGKMALTSGYTATELKRMYVREFFITVYNWEKSLKDKSNGKP